MRILAILISIAFLYEPATASNDRAASECMMQFLSAYKRSSTYQVRIKKTENLDRVRQQNILLVEQNKKDITLVYEDEGSTGIRNNGMTVSYDGSSKLRVKLGKIKGLGFLVGGIAALISRNEMSLYDPQVTNNEIFTVDRAGVGYLASLLRRNLDLFKSDKWQTLKVNRSCEISYVPADSGYDEIVVRPDESISSIEQNVGTLAFLIYESNKDKFSSFSGLFRRTTTVTLKYPRHFVRFDLTLDDVTHFPKLFRIYWNEKVIGTYEFQDYQIH